MKAYSLAADRRKIEMKKFYEQVNSLMRAYKSYNVTLFMGDMNTKVHEGPSATVTGRMT